MKSLKTINFTAGQEALSSPLHHGVAEDGHVLADGQVAALVDVGPNHLRVLKGNPVTLRVQSRHHHERLEQSNVLFVFVIFMKARTIIYFDLSLLRSFKTSTFEYEIIGQRRNKTHWKIQKN